MNSGGPHISPYSRLDQRRPVVGQPWPQLTLDTHQDQTSNLFFLQLLINFTPLPLCKHLVNLPCAGKLVLTPRSITFIRGQVWYFAASEGIRSFVALSKTIKSNRPRWVFWEAHPLHGGEAGALPVMRGRLYTVWGAGVEEEGRADEAARAAAVVQDLVGQAAAAAAAACTHYTRGISDMHTFNVSGQNFTELVNIQTDELVDRPSRKKNKDIKTWRPGNLTTAKYVYVCI